EIQQVTVNATSGSFVLRYPKSGGARDSGPIQFDASAAAVETAIGETQSGLFAPGDVSVSGPAGGPWAIEFTGTRADEDALQFQIANSTLSGPGTAAVTTTQGGANYEICVPANGDLCHNGQPGSKPGQLSAPQGVAVDVAGNVYAFDILSSRVEKFDSEGHFLFMIGGQVNKTAAETV